MPSDGPDSASMATPSSTSSQESTTPVQAATLNITNKTKANSKKAKDPNDAVVLLARLAEQEGKYISPESI